MKKAFILCLIPSFFACNYADLPGMFIVESSINERFEQSEAYNNNHAATEINTSSDEYIITVAADAHIGKTKNFDLFVQNSKDLHAEAMVMNGDMCNGNDYDYNLLEQHLPDWSQQKYFLTAGNHELYFDGWKYFYEKFGSSTYYFSIKTNNRKDLFICLDSGSGTLGSKQLAWLKNLLETKRTEFQHCIIFSHNNIHRIRHTGSTNPVTDEVLAISNLFLKHNVNMVIMGHDHIRNIATLGNTQFITLDALVDNFYRASFLKLTISDAGIISDFIKLAS